jgi:anti-sigma regulatory factor (Ser/Thr protein kinase)
MRSIQSMEVRDEAEVGAVRRVVHRYAVEIGFDERELAEIDIVVQELGTNAARYAQGGGQIHFTRTLGAEPGLELFYTDQGPGIYDLERVVRDGVSTGGSLGTGLGAVRRLMDEFEAYSTILGTGRLASRARRTTHGTALLLRKWVAAIAAPRLSKGTHDSARRRAAHQVSGRARTRRRTKTATLISSNRRAGPLLSRSRDGLGHGRGAHEGLPGWRSKFSPAGRASR